MSKVAALFLSFIFSVLILSGCKAATSSKHIITIVPAIALPAVVVVDRKKEPGAPLLDRDKILSYQLRHHYTLFCGGVGYGVSSYRVTQFKVEATLLSGYAVKLPHTCTVSPGNPVNSVYVIERPS